MIGRGKDFGLHSSKGSFGEVVKAIHLISKEVRAIKIIEKRKINSHALLRELQQSEFEVL